MAKFGVLETDPSMAAKATEELKKELQRLISSSRGPLILGFETENPALPQEFRCPISKQLMRDPVVVATGQGLILGSLMGIWPLFVVLGLWVCVFMNCFLGKRFPCCQTGLGTYDRPFIQKWLKDGHRTCPRTQQVLSHTILTPNNLVREMISEWCKEHGIELPKPVEDVDEEVITDADRGHLNSLLERMSSSAPDQKEAARELRLLTKRMPSFRALFGECTDAVPQLLSPLSPDAVDVDPELPRGFDHHSFKSLDT
ncbi:U-box domain-containing protein 9 [Vitis vinifera]|uniref:U-box domain-containing protein 9 n=1 Tax=Vitis vinifera TaxID=29760 RepID=A0A438D7D6_VITVI|nr:U-box domain-containing protein 9 [Vitis vinifera]